VKNILFANQRGVNALSSTASKVSKNHFLLNLLSFAHPKESSKEKGASQGRQRSSPQLTTVCTGVANQAVRAGKETSMFLLPAAPVHGRLKFRGTF